MTASSRAGPRDGQKIASALVETASGHSESASALVDPGSGETAHGQKEIVTSHSGSASFHETNERSVERERNPRDKPRSPRDREPRCSSREFRPRGGIGGRSGSGLW